MQIHYTSFLFFSQKVYFKTYAGFRAASSSLECNINNTDLRSSQKKTLGFFAAKNNFKGAERYESEAIRGAMTEHERLHCERIGS